MSKHHRGLSDDEVPDRPSRRLKLEPNAANNHSSTSLSSRKVVLSHALESNQVTSMSTDSLQGTSPENSPFLMSSPKNFVIKDATFIGLSQESDTTPLPFTESSEGRKIRKALVKKIEFAPLPDKCLPGTRVTILNQVDAKILDSGNTNIIWIKGFPGVGKSTVASTVISRLQEQGQLLSYFIFDRAQPTVTTTRNLWCRVAWDFARLFPSTRKALLQCIDDEPVGINIPGIIAFFEALIEGPLSYLSDDVFGLDRPALVIVIDAVDECGGLDGPRSKDRKDFLTTLEQWHSKLPRNIKLVLTSREEDDLNRRLLPISSLIDFSMTTEEDFHDIHEYLLLRLGRIAELYSTSLPSDWVDKTANYLAERAEGVFVWATTAANYIECGEPQSQLQDIRSGLGLGVEGGSLFSLYRVLLKTSFKNMRDKQREAFKSVAGAMILARRPFCDVEFTAINPVVSITMLQYIRIGLRSVVARSGNLRFSHPSFIDFLLSPECPDDFAINQSERQGQLTVLCLTTMSAHLRFNICNLETSYLKNTDIPDLEAKVKNGISSLLSYSCCFVADHLSHTASNNDIVRRIKVLFEEKFLFWLETMSLLGEMNRTVEILGIVLNWTFEKDGDVSDFLRDALRFIQAFSIPISQSAPHIYLSALPFAPEKSIVGRHFLPKFPGIATLTSGKPSHWSSCIFTSEAAGKRIKATTFSRDERLFASVSINGIICIWDSESGNLISGPFGQGMSSTISFSPDTKRIIVTGSDGSAFVWDVKAGTPYMHIQDTEGNDSSLLIKSATFSADGRFIVSVSRPSPRAHDKTGRIQLWDAETGTLTNNLLDGPKIRDDFALSLSGNLLALWSKGVTDNLEIWDLSTWPESPSHVFESNMGQNNSERCSLQFFGDSGEFLFALYEDSEAHSKKMLCLQRTTTGTFTSHMMEFHDRPQVLQLQTYWPKHDVLIFRSQGAKTTLIDARKGIVTHAYQEPAVPCSVSTSRDGRRMLVGYSDGTIRMWDHQDRAAASQTAMDQLALPDSLHGYVAFSPCGDKLAVCCGDEIRIWNTGSGEAINLSSPIQCKGSAMLAFSSDGASIASVKLNRYREITEDRFDIWDAKTGLNLYHSGLKLPVPVPQFFVKLCQLFFRPSDNRLIMTTICASNEGSEDKVAVWEASAHVFGYDHELNEPGMVVMCRGTLHESSSSRDDPATVATQAHEIFLSPDTLNVIIADKRDHSYKPYHCRHRITTEDDFVTHTEFDSQTFQGCISGKATFSRSGRLFASISQCYNFLRVWETETWKVVAGPLEVNGKSFSAAVAVAPNDHFVACFTDSGVRVWDIHTGHLVAGPWYGHHCFNPQIFFTPDGGKLASVSMGSTPYSMRLWDLHDLRDRRDKQVQRSVGDFRNESVIQDGWVLGQDNRSLLFWVPIEHRNGLYRPGNTAVIGGKTIKLDLTSFRNGEDWEECIDREWLRKCD